MKTTKNDGSIEKYRTFKDTILFLTAKKDEIERYEKDTIEKNKTAPKQALKVFREDCQKFIDILTDCIESQPTEPTAEEVKDYIENTPTIESIKETLRETPLNEINTTEEQLEGIVKLMLFTRQKGLMISNCFKLIESFESRQGDRTLQAIKQEIIEYWTIGATADEDTGTSTDTTNGAKNTNPILKTLNSEFFQLSTERIINNLNKKEYDEKQKIQDQKYFYIFDLNLKNREDCPYTFNKSDFLTMEDTYFLNGINTLYSEAKGKNIAFKADNSDGTFNTFYGFFLIDLYNLLNGKKDRGEINKEALEELKKELYKLSCTWLKIDLKRKDGRDLKKNNKKENFYINNINSQLLYFKSIGAKRESDGRNKNGDGTEGQIDFIYFFEEPLLLKMRNLENTVTRVDKRLMEIKQPNQNSREVNFYLIRTIELLKAQGQKKINIETVEKALTKDIKTTQQRKDLKKLIKKRLEHFKKLDYIKGFEMKRDYILLNFGSKKSIEI